MPVMLEVAIGLVFVYLVLSLLSSAIAEALEHYLRYRADYLRQGVGKLLLGNDGPLLAKLYAHPLIASLYTKSSFEGWGRAGGPSYIPSRQFVLALLDIVKESGGAGDGPVAQLKASVAANAALPASLKTALNALIDDAGDDVEKVKTNVQEWFDGSMDRVAGWYKRRAQFVLFIIGVFATVAVNVDTLAIVNTLSNDSAVRTAVVSAAEAYVRTNPPKPPEGAAPTEEQATKSIRESVTAVSNQLGSLGLPVGWRWENDQGVDRSAGDQRTSRDYQVANRILPTTFTAMGQQLGAHFLGWLLTAIAVSFGAPFWFDVLNKIMVIRSTVKPREKSREEGSEDRAGGGAPQTVRIEVAAAKP